MVAATIAKKLKPLTKKIVDKLKKNEDLTRTERKAVRDHAKAKGSATSHVPNRVSDDHVLEDETAHARCVPSLPRRHLPRTHQLFERHY